MRGKEDAVREEKSLKGPHETDSSAEESVFKPESLVDIAIKQKRLVKERVPSVCILDPDGDIVRYLVKSGRAEKSRNWPCYHTDMYLFNTDEMRFGIVGCAVGSPFAVLVAEELFALGCELLISVTSAGLVNHSLKRPCFMLIEKSLIDEGTSRQYLPESEFAELNGELKTVLNQLVRDGRMVSGVAWTTDAPFRETLSKINHMRKLRIDAVEMESSALYSLAKFKGVNIVCLAHITNEMGVGEDDFDKGEDEGSRESLKLIIEVAKRISKASA